MSRVFLVMGEYTPERVLGQIMRETRMNGQDREMPRHYTPRGRALFQHKLWQRKQAFVRNNQYLLTLALKEKEAYELTSSSYIALHHDGGQKGSFHSSRPLLALPV